jgi:UDP-hydrolysing UDP-N-acetyl-D-glucosamine 2-epimerase
VRKLRKISVLLVDRANYGRMYPVMRALKEDPDVLLQVICAGTMMLERFGKAEKMVENDGFKIDHRVFLEVEGSVPVTMSKSIGLGIIEFTNVYQQLQPDMLLLIGDRYEALAASIAGAYMNIPIAHIQGGEISGSIDESARHAITKFSHIHFPATARAADYLVRMGEDPAHVHNVGCPAGDYIRELDTNLPSNIFNQMGVGANIDPGKPFLLVIYHPVTTAFGNEKEQAEQLIYALHDLAMPTVWLWPNIDAGSDNISKVIRMYREKNSSEWLHLVKNLNPKVFQKCLKKTICAIGNSSSFVRDSTFSGTPVVLIGDRQDGREHGNNLTAVEPVTDQIKSAIKRQVENGRYEPDTVYGDGNASDRIIEKLKSFIPYSQKTLYYRYQ